MVRLRDGRRAPIVFAKAPLTTSELVLREQREQCENHLATLKLRALPKTCLIAVKSPLNFNWALSEESWTWHCRRDKLYTRNPDYMMRNPSLEPELRAGLLDFLIQVCEGYRFYRETYHLALDFIDRFLATQSDLPRKELTLIGITCLFIAAKIEETNPPTLSQLIDLIGASTESEILAKEVVIIKSLNWELAPTTANCWFGIYMQLASTFEECVAAESKENKSLFSGHTFVQGARLLDLCTFDIDSLRYPNSVIAAAVMYHSIGESVALKSSGYTWGEISSCVYWMARYTLTLRELGPVQVKTYSKIPLDEAHNIQSHDVDFQLFTSAQNRRLF